ncbi:DUF501 domain-containing protein [Aidingimonas halophila]|uniref:DUF501 domain-containing protein n=1 Tax=Aidingimonas halophila TaxID=574349 RepID=A0A1H2VXD0_9GAMM|nr:DUF501 domain-containing protein [Aidingimonas halophila]GHC24914.1 hypothetical protein GCM10008094_15130 [Aidingimonas halophila]SDW72906.1 hypothetical protein SAMN05443545_102514 [Aidingimonas halophila]
MVTQVDQAPDQYQLDIIAKQLGKAPLGLDAIAASDEQGVPLVLRMSPIIDGRPFPTLYWLCDTRLNLALSKLEAKGLIKQLESRLSEDTALLAAYHQSHEDYVSRRWHYMTQAQRQQIESRGYRNILESRGIGGISNWNQVRCLHMQYAHHLCGSNVIGEWLDAEFSIADSLST